MKKKHWISIFAIILVLVAISIFNFILNFKLIKDVKNYKALSEFFEQTVTLNETLLANLFGQSLLSSGMVLKDIHVTNEQGSSVRLKTLFDNNPKLVLRISEINCMTCIDSSLKYIEKYKNIIGHQNIIVLASYKRQQDVHTFKRISQVSLEIFNTGDITLGLPIENENAPYMFVTNDGLIVQSLFLPEKTMPLLSDMYFKIVIHRFFPNKK